MKDIKARLSQTRMPKGSRAQPTIKITLTGQAARKLLAWAYTRDQKGRAKPAGLDVAVSNLLEAPGWRELAQGYAQQLQEIGALLVKGRVISKRNIERYGVRFAMQKKFGTKLRDAKAKKR